MHLRFQCAMTSQDDDAAVEIINSFALMSVQALCDQLSSFLHIEKRLEGFVFDNSEMSWEVQWNGNIDANDWSEASAPRVFNNPEFRRALRNILTRGRILTRRFGFCAIYYLKKTARVMWWRRYLKADALERANLGLPLGVVEPNMAVFERVSPKSCPLDGEIRVRFVGPYASQAEKYDTVVFDAGASFKPTPQKMYEHMRAARARTVLSEIGKSMREEINTYHTRQNANVVPTSEFYDLIDEYHRLEEVRANYMNAEAQLSQTSVIYQVRKADLRPANVEEIPQSRLFEDTTVLQEKLRQVSEVERFTLEEAQERIDAINYNMNGGRVTGEDLSQQVQARRMALGRPSPYDEVVTLPQTVELAHYGRPSIIHDLTYLEQHFRESIAACMKVPRTMTEGTTARTGAIVNHESQMFNGTRNMETAEQRLLDETVLRERAFHRTFFEFIYNTVFGALDIDELDKTFIYLSLVETSLSSDEGATELGLALAERSSAIKRSQETRSYIRKLFDSLEECPRALARLHFQPNQTREIVNQITGLLNLYNNGLIDAASMESRVQVLYGPEIKINKQAVALPLLKFKKKRRKRNRSDGIDDPFDDVPRPNKRPRKNKDRRPQIEEMQ